ncbi:MAG: CrcB family protein [Cryobacterium sp.]|nr:CrcB family protein [Cryobacterium sp.]
MTGAAVGAAIAAGGGAAIVRYLVSLWFARVRSAAESDAPARAAFPWAVLVVNVVGSALGGAVLALGAQSGISPDTQFVLLFGVCGGLSTFSTFSVETIQLVNEGQLRRAVLSVSANLALGLAACALGFTAFGGASLV